VLPLVLHNGKGRWRAPLRLESHFVSVPKGLKRYLPRLTYLLLDECRLDLNRPELERNPTAAGFRFETNELPEAMPRLYRGLNDLLPPEDAAMHRTVHAWITSVVQRAFPDGIIPEGLNLEEAPMLEETLIKWRDTAWKDGLQAGRREGRQEGRREGLHEGLLAGRRGQLLELMTQRFGRLPIEIRQRVGEIGSIQELRKLGRKVLRAKSLEEMGLGTKPPRPSPRGQQ
jgi:hypothetical protein